MYEKIAITIIAGAAMSIGLMPKEDSDSVYKPMSAMPAITMTPMPDPIASPTASPSPLPSAQPTSRPTPSDPGPSPTGSPLTSPTPSPTM